MIDKSLLNEGKKVKRYLFGTVGWGVIVAFLTIAQAWYLSRIIAQVFLEGATFQQIQKELLVILLIIILRGLGQYYSETTAREAAIRVKESLRNRFIHKVLALGPIFSRGERAGELLNTAVEGIEALDDYFARYLPQLVLAVIIPLLTVAFVLPQDFKSALILVITGPLIPFFMMLIGKLAEQKSRRQWKVLSFLSAHYLDMLQGLATLKIFGRSKDQGAVIARVSDTFRKTTLNVMTVAFLSAFVLEFMGMISTAVIAVALGLRLLNGTVPYGEALFVLILAPEFYLPLRNLGLHFHAKMSGTNAANRIFEVLSVEEKLQTANKGVGTEKGKPSEGTIQPLVTLEKVELRYHINGEIILDNIDFVINMGERIGLLGPSGAGKTSILNLILGFAFPTKGEIRVSDIPLEKISPKVWREYLSYVPQRPYLFAGSIIENVRFGKKDADFTEIVKACKEALIHDFISQLPQGYETKIGEGGARLSGGQAQRLAIARAFLKDAPILLLDEITSGLDMENEGELLRVLDVLCQGRTVIFTSHRMRTTLQADRLIVLDGGKIIEEGTPRELAHKEGLYAQYLNSYGREG